jgi:GH25 family lysozyme M1 (1,4-beta-N-acetylmuramidase)
MSSEHQQQVALDWLNTVEQASGHVPWIYGGESFLRELQLPVTFKRYPLIVAHYGCLPSQVRVPAPWDKYLAWQFTDAGSVPGLALGHHVDSNWFAGTADDFKKLVIV